MTRGGGTILSHHIRYIFFVGWHTCHALRLRNCARKSNTTWGLVWGWEGRKEEEIFTPSLLIPCGIPKVGGGLRNIDLHPSPPTLADLIVRKLKPGNCECFECCECLYMCTGRTDGQRLNPVWSVTGGRLIILTELTVVCLSVLCQGLACRRKQTNV